MLPLYYGYLVFQLYLVVGLFYKVSISASAVFFSVIVFIIWTFLPVLGYGLAKLMKAKGQASHKALFFIGLSIGLLEQSWFYFNITIRDQSNISTLLVFMLFFISAFITIPAKKTHVLEQIN